MGLRYKWLWTGLSHEDRVDLGASPQTWEQPSVEKEGFWICMDTVASEGPPGQLAKSGSSCKLA